MRTPILAIATLAMLPLGACASDNGGGGYGYDRPGYNRPPGDRGRDRRPPRHLGDNDQIYRDRDGRYYCKRDDGTTGTIVGAIAGGVLGNVIAPGGSKTLGTILGGAGGALAGRAIDKNDINCE
ncbi:glycine zipper 2TM domain-containing protein [Sphingobium sp. AP49]|uniref:glycine zipper 2TM domain-containing protein n=1 Tax=Sphingobium sp. AP49 TaxID=1144307 RepID=UPI00026EE736|nr:glycine zipper 2TM domain-containing protein [Sphingobium sp. AP49]WHO37844.1 glycine zipper 2TM domain-containing protein [Sphingobium sp. AP49]